MTETPYVIPLGVSAALPAPGSANTYLVVARGEKYWLVDCADSPLARIQQAGLDPLGAQGVIITHFHPDHVYGLPAFLLGLFLFGLEHKRPRKMPLPIFARPEVLERVQAMMALHDPQSLEGMYPLIYHPVAPEMGVLIAKDDDFEITAAPTRHSVPSLAVRFALPGLARAFVYSSDTGPSPEVEELARGATLLFHEATGTAMSGHSSPAEAGALAARAGVARLVLIHYNQAPPPETLQMLIKAQEAFGKPVELAQEFQVYTW